MEWSESISEAINYIESHITEELTIADIAKQAIISPYYFQKGFSMLCGFTVGEYIKRRRLTLAGSEIVSTDRKIIDMIRRIVLQKHFFVFMVLLLLPYAKERQ